jgi:hypothetical protein
MNRIAIALLVLAGTLSGCAQFGQDDHAAHHPPRVGPGPGGMGPRAGMGPTDDAFAEQMRRMQDMHARMQAARTPAERQALMDEQHRLMQSGMAMMGPMGGMGMEDGGGMGMGGMSGRGGMGPGAQPGPMAGGGRDASPGPMGMPGAQGGPGKSGGDATGMGCAADMQRRMAMMQMMMQMMVDRDAATSK